MNNKSFEEYLKEGTSVGTAPVADISKTTNKADGDSGEGEQAPAVSKAKAKSAESNAKEKDLPEKLHESRAKMSFAEFMAEGTAIGTAPVADISKFSGKFSDGSSSENVVEKENARKKKGSDESVARQPKVPNLPNPPEDDKHLSNPPKIICESCGK